MITGDLMQEPKRGTWGVCPSRLELSAYEARGVAAGLAPHIQSCSRCQTMVRELAAARIELLGSDPQEASLLAARRIERALVAAHQEKRQRLWRWLPAGLVPLAALAMLVLGPRLGETPSRISDEAPQSGLGVRAKGGLVLQIIAKRGDEQFALTDGADAKPGDRLRFSYTKPADGYLMVFSVDDAGEVSPYYQDGKLKGMPISAGTRMLPGSIELDGHQGWERVFALWSWSALDEAAVRVSVTAALRQAGDDVRKLDRLPLSTEVDQSTVLLRRP